MASKPACWSLEQLGLQSSSLDFWPLPSSANTPNEVSPAAPRPAVTKNAGDRRRPLELVVAAAGGAAVASGGRRTATRRFFSASRINAVVVTVSPDAITN